MLPKISASHAINFDQPTRDRMTAGVLKRLHAADNEPFPREPWSVRIDPATWLRLREEANGRKVEDLIEEILTRHLSYFSRFSGKL